MKNIGDEAQFSARERAAFDKSKVRHSPDIRKMWGLRFEQFNSTFYFGSEMKMIDRKAHYENIYGEGKIIRPRL